MAFGEEHNVHAQQCDATLDKQSIRQKTQLRRNGYMPACLHLMRILNGKILMKKRRASYGRKPCGFSFP